MAKKNYLDWAAIVLVIIGALNWGLIAVTKLDLVATLFGQMSIISRIVYGLVGVAGLYMIYYFTK